MSRRRRRRADPAKLPRRDPATREQRAERDRAKQERERAKQEVDRVHDGLARAISISLAAVVYFGAWVANAFLNLFPQPVGFDIANPLLLVGIGSLIGATILGRYLVRTVSLRRLTGFGVVAVLGLGAVLGIFVLLFVVTGGSSGTLLGVIGGLALSWVAASLWIALLTRRARRLLRSSEGVAA